MDKVFVGITFALAFLLGISIQSGGRNWVDAPEQGYFEPKCPPGSAPDFWGVVVTATGVSQPVYVCQGGREKGPGVSWGELQSESTQQPG